MSINRWVVSDGTTGRTTIAGAFPGPQEANAAFERAHGRLCRGVALAYRIGDDDDPVDIHAVDEAGHARPLTDILKCPLPR